MLQDSLTHRTTNRISRQNTWKRMVKKFSYILLFLLVVPLVFMASPLFAGGKRSSAVDFELQTFDGEPVVSETLHNKVILLDFWDINSQTSLSSLTQIAALEEYFNMNLDVVIIAVNIGHESMESVKSFVERSKHNIFFAYDKDAKLAKAMEVRDVPTIIVIDKEYNYHARMVMKSQSQESHIMDEYKRMIEGLL